MEKIKTTNWFAISLIYIAFFSLIGLTVWVTCSSLPLLGLLFTPSVKNKINDSEEYTD